MLVQFCSLQIPAPLEGRQNALGIVVTKGCRTAHMFAWSKRLLNVSFSRNIPTVLPYVGFLSHHQTRTDKKEFLERQRRERGNFGDVCDGFLPNRPKK